MENNKTLYLVIATVLLFSILLASWFFNKNNEKKAQQSLKENTQSQEEVNPQVDPQIKNQIDELRELQNQGEQAATPTPEVVNKQLEELEQVRIQISPEQETKALTEEEIQAQLKQLQKMQ